MTDENKTTLHNEKKGALGTNENTLNIVIKIEKAHQLYISIIK